MQRWPISNMVTGRESKTLRVNLMTYKYSCMIMIQLAVGLLAWRDRLQIQVSDLKLTRRRILISKGDHRLRDKEKQLRPRLLPISPTYKTQHIQQRASSTSCSS